MGFHPRFQGSELSKAEHIAGISASHCQQPTQWEIAEKAALGRLRDLRHTAATKMAEAGTPGSTMLSIMGHMRRAMMERYSHVRMAAKREAVQSLSMRPKQAKQEVISTISITVEQSGQIQ
jgi:hypothetical protein